MSLTYCPGTFWTTTFALCTGASESACKPFMNSILLPYSLLHLLDIALLVFKTRHLGLVSTKLHICEIPSYCGSRCQCGSFGQDHIISDFPTHLSIPCFLNNFLWSFHSAIFQVFFKMNFPDLAVDLVCSWEEVSWIFTYACHLGLHLVRV